MEVKDRIAITEKQWESHVKGLARLFGYLYYHTWRSIHSPAGFPDCVLTRAGRTIIAKLKTDRRKSKLTVEQARWLWELRKTPNLEVYVWRPRHFEKIMEVLRKESYDTRS